MLNRLLFFLVFALCFSRGVAVLFAQQQFTAPRIGYVCPAGGQQGTSFTVIASGVLLDSASGVVVSGGGVSATIEDRMKPMSQASSILLLDKIKALQEKKRAARTSGVKINEKDISTLEEMQKMFASFPPLLRGNPSLSEYVVMKVTIAPDAVPGDREIRLRTATGLTNPRVFQVGQLPEWTKPTAKTERRFERGGESKSVASTENTVTIPVVVNGQILQGGVDRFRFTAKKGTKLVIVANARHLIPYLPDAVPGWFQAMLTLYDSSRNEMHYADHFFFHPDPVLYYDIQHDGEFIAEIRDSIYRGREDFVYRIIIGEIPFITGIFPLGTAVQADAKVEVKGWNLPSETAVWRADGKPAGVYQFSVSKNGLISNTVPFAVSTVPEKAEKEANSSEKTAQAIRFPVIINGRIDPPGEQDVFKFEAAAGTQVVAEVFARRLNSPMDSFLKITDSRGKLVASNDDSEDKGVGLNTHHADSRVQATLMDGGTYFITLTDTQHQGGSEFAYRLSIGAPQQDFELRATPSSLNIKGITPAQFSVFALRKNGFTGPIKLALKNAPPKFYLSKETIPANEDKVDTNISIPLGLLDEPVAIEIEGSADIGGQSVVRRIVPAEDMMQAFLYRHLVPSQQLLLDTMGRLPTPYNPKLISFSRISIPHGKSGEVRLAIPGYISNRLVFELVSPPLGISLGKIKNGPEAEIEILSDKLKTKVGQEGVIQLAMKRKPFTFSKQKEVSLPNAAPTPVDGTIPTISFEITEPEEPKEP